MDILIIGNGFDIAHDLPTKYSEFMTIAKMVITETDVSEDTYYELCSKFALNMDKENLLDEFKWLLKSNVWFNFLLERLENGRLSGENWIDFEAEIKKVILRFEDVEENEFNQFPLIFNTYLQDEAAYRDLLRIVIGKIIEQDVNVSNLFYDSGSNDITFTHKGQFLISEYLYEQLRNLTRAFEIYCVCLINKINDEFVAAHSMIEINDEIQHCTTSAISYDRKMKEITASIKFENSKLFLQSYSSDISAIRSRISQLNAELENENRLKQENENILNDLISQYDRLCVFRKLKADYVLSFNYTNTFASRYGTENTQYCYIHGAAESSAENTNMILGIDETLLDKDAETNFTFSKFKKFFQRIFYKTGAQYRDWISAISHEPNYRDVDIYILGHSFGTTDHDVLREFFDLGNNSLNLGAKVRISVFYHDEFAKINAIQRVIEIIGKSELVERVHGENWSVRFVKQDDIENGIIK